MGAVSEAMRVVSAIPRASLPVLAVGSRSGSWVVVGGLARMPVGFVDVGATVGVGSAVVVVVVSG